MELPRILHLSSLLKKKSFFLFGPRATGKSTLVRQQLAGRATVIDLLRSQVYLRLLDRPHELEAIIAAGPEPSLVVINEIQRIPDLLNEVHRLIEEKQVTFLLTGSSARKLRRGRANLLAGRVWQARLFPLVWREIPDFDLNRYLQYGGLPSVYLSNDPDEELDAYVNTYLKEEIMAEGLVRRLPPFSRFLHTMALANGEIINLTKLGSDCQVPPSTVSAYVSLLEDTLVGFMLPAWRGSRKRKAISTAKFYFFDPGVTHTLAGTTALERNSNIYGRSFEQFIGMEIRACLDYTRRKDVMRFWRSTSGYEVNFLVGTHTAIEVKATQRTSSRDFKGLKKLAQEGVFQHFLLVSQDPVPRRDKQFRALPWHDFLHELWTGMLW